MPTYEYECLNCGHHFEIFQMMSDPPVKTCPKCRKRVRRIIGTGGGIIFKGAGFYATDYRKPDPSKAKQPQDKKSEDKQPQDKKSHKKEDSETKDTKS